jgi:hypothetical protein
MVLKKGKKNEKFYFFYRRKCSSAKEIDSAPKSVSSLVISGEGNSNYAFSYLFCAYQLRRKSNINETRNL